MSERRIFTFGDGQAFPGGYVVIDAANVFSSARAAMVRAFGTRWSMEYDSEDDAGVSKYGLTEVEICTNCWGCKARPWNYDAMDGVALFCPKVFEPFFKCQKLWAKSWGEDAS